MRRFLLLSPLFLCGCRAITRRLIEVFVPVIIGGCLVGCTATLESPAKALGFSNPKVKVWKNIVGAGAEIPTDATGKCSVEYDAVTGSFKGDGEFQTSASGVIAAEAERAKVALPLAMKNSDNQTQLNLASIQAQQAVWEKGFETIGSVGGAFLARPAGAAATGPAGLLATVLPMLTDAGIKPADVIKAITSPTEPTP